MTSGDVLEEPLDIEQPRLQHDAAVFVTGQIQQILDDALEPAGFAIDRCEVAMAAIRVEHFPMRRRRACWCRWTCAAGAP